MEDFDRDVDGGVGSNEPAPFPSVPKEEQTKFLLANLLVMQELMAARLDALVDILVASEVLGAKELEAMNADTNEVLEGIRQRGVSKVE